LRSIASRACIDDRSIYSLNSSKSINRRNEQSIIARNFPDRFNILSAEDEEQAWIAEFLAQDSNDREALTALPAC